MNTESLSHWPLRQPLTPVEKETIKRLPLGEFGLCIENSELHWMMEREDWTVVAELWAILQKTAILADAKFHSQIVPLIFEKILPRISLFAFLNTDKIQTSQAHGDTTPFEHIQNACLCLNTSLVSNQRYIGLLRLATIFHDVGKIIYVKDGCVNGKDEDQKVLRHGRIGRFLAAVLLRDIEMRKSEQELVLAMIEYHHVFHDLKAHELDKTGELELTFEMIEHPELAKLIFVLLTVADPLSNSVHQEGANDHIKKAKDRRWISAKQEKYLSGYVNSRRDAQASESLVLTS